MTLRGVLPNLAEAKRHDSEAAPATEPCGSVLSPADAGQCSRASSLARDLSLDRATSRSLIRNSTIGRSSTTVRLARHPGSGFRYRCTPSAAPSARPQGFASRPSIRPSTPKAVESLVANWERLVTFFDFP